MQLVPLLLRTMIILLKRVVWKHTDSKGLPIDYEKDAEFNQDRSQQTVYEKTEAELHFELFTLN